MIKRAFVNGEAIPREAVEHEFDRLARLYAENGMPAEELKKNVEKLLAQAQEQAAAAAAAATAMAAAVPTDSWACPQCGTANTGKFCGECGTPKPVPEPPAEWACPQCGTTNAGKFCGECGTPRP